MEKAIWSDGAALGAISRGFADLEGDIPIKSNY
jgi:hypothetical protein